MWVTAAAILAECGRGRSYRSRVVVGVAQPLHTDTLTHTGDTQKRGKKSRQRWWWGCPTSSVRAPNSPPKKFRPKSRAHLQVSIKWPKVSRPIGRYRPIVNGRLRVRFKDQSGLPNIELFVLSASAILNRGRSQFHGF